jgi:hypothetical protein
MSALTGFPYVFRFHLISARQVGATGGIANRQLGQGESLSEE